MAELPIFLILISFFSMSRIGTSKFNCNLFIDNYSPSTWYSTCSSNTFDGNYLLLLFEAILRFFSTTSDAFMFLSVYYLNSLTLDYYATC